MGWGIEQINRVCLDGVLRGAQNITHNAVGVLVGLPGDVLLGGDRGSVLHVLFVGLLQNLSILPEARSLQRPEEQKGMSQLTKGTLL